MFGGLDGIGVLVTRPAAQANEIVRAIEAAGGRAFRLPVMDVVPRDADAIAAELSRRARPDIVVFVSTNAVRYGLAALTKPQPTVAAIGPATTAALERAGVTVDVTAANGFTSEQLLAAPGFRDISGRRILIVRGDSGRELLAETLRDRGAEVDYLSVYQVTTHRCTEEEVGSLRESLDRDAISATILMSGAALEHLLAALPPDCVDRIARTRLVAPGERVIKTVQERLPGSHCIESPGPRAEDIVAALVTSFENAPTPR